MIYNFEIRPISDKPNKNMQITEAIRNLNSTEAICVYVPEGKSFESLRKILSTIARRFEAHVQGNRENNCLWIYKKPIKEN